MVLPRLGSNVTGDIIFPKFGVHRHTPQFALPSRADCFDSEYPLLAQPLVEATDGSIKTCIALIDGSPKASHLPLSLPLDQAAASFSFFSGRTLIFREAGLAANTCSRPVKRLMPLRFGFAGTLMALIFR